MSMSLGVKNIINKNKPLFTIVFKNDCHQSKFCKITLTDFSFTLLALLLFVIFHTNCCEVIRMYMCVCIRYSKTCLKRSLNRQNNKGLKATLYLNVGHESIMQYF